MNAYFHISDNLFLLIHEFFITYEYSLNSTLKCLERVLFSVKSFGVWSVKWQGNALYFPLSQWVAIMNQQYGYVSFH